MAHAACHTVPPLQRTLALASVGRTETPAHLARRATRREHPLRHRRDCRRPRRRKRGALIPRLIDHSCATRRPTRYATPLFRRLLLAPVKAARKRGRAACTAAERGQAAPKHACHTEAAAALYPRLERWSPSSGLDRGRSARRRRARARARSPTLPASQPCCSPCWSSQGWPTRKCHGLEVQPRPLCRRPRRAFCALRSAFRRSLARGLLAPQALP